MPQTRLLSPLPRDISNGRLGPCCRQPPGLAAVNGIASNGDSIDPLPNRAAIAAAAASVISSSRSGICASIAARTSPPWRPGTNRLDHILGDDRCKAGGGKVSLHRGNIVVRRRDQRCRVAGQELPDYRDHHIPDGALAAAPHAEQETTAGPQNTQSLAKRRHLVGEEHDTELADDVVELLIGEWQRQSVRFLPLDPSRRLERNVLDTGRRWVV